MARYSCSLIHEYLTKNTDISQKKYDTIFWLFNFMSINEYIYVYINKYSQMGGSNVKPAKPTPAILNWPQIRLKNWPFLEIFINFWPQNALCDMCSPIAILNHIIAYCKFLRPYILKKDSVHCFQLRKFRKIDFWVVGSCHKCSKNAKKMILGVFGVFKQ